MKILVCISVVPDTTTKITFTDNDTTFNKAGVQFIVNPYDELAVTRALEIAEANNGTVTIVHVGEADSEPSIRKALSMGANEAIRINAVPVDAQFVAEEIAKIAGALLNIPSINVVTKIDYNGGNFTFDRDIDGGKETLTCAGPLVASAQKDLCEPRIPNMRGIMAARTKPLQIIEASVSNQAANYQSYSLPAAKGSVKLIDAENAGELINILKNEVKVI